ncbi:MAG: hypothetical protein ACPGSG_01875 [Prolixibacteraceae bacterium]
MVRPWFVHGLSIDLGVFDGGTMEKAWTNHGESRQESTVFFSYSIENRKDKYGT